MTEYSEEPEIEHRRAEEILAVTITSETIYDKLIVKCPMLKTLRILSWIKYFVTNCKKQELRGPLTPSEIKNRR